MTPEQEERLITALEKIADELDMLTDCVGEGHFYIKTKEA